MDEIAQRLKDASDRCLEAYTSWSKAKKDGKLRETMQEAVHELRKVAARLEIDMAASEREDLQQRPIPIPPHRSQHKKPKDDLALPTFITAGTGGPGNVAAAAAGDEDYDDDDGQQPIDPSGDRPARRPGGGQSDMQRRMRRPGGPRQGGGNTQPRNNDE